MGDSSNELIPNSEFVRRLRAKCQASMVKTKHSFSTSTPLTVQWEEKIPSQDHKGRKDELAVLVTGQGAKKSFESAHCSGSDPDWAKQPLTTATTIPEAQEALGLRDQVVPK